MSSKGKLGNGQCRSCHKEIRVEGRGGGQVVSILAFYSDNPSSNPTEAYSFPVIFVFEKKEMIKKRLKLALFKKKK